MNTKLISYCAASLLMVGCASGPRSTPAIRTYTLPSWGNEAPRLQIDLPSSFSMRRNSGPDFDVFYFSDPSTGSSMGLYSGHHPGLRSREAGVTHVSSQPGRVGDIPVEWSRWSQAGEYRSETLVHDFYGPTPRADMSVSSCTCSRWPLPNGMSNSCKRQRLR